MTIFYYIAAFFAGAAVQCMVSAFLQVRRERKLEEQKKLEQLNAMLMTLLSERNKNYNDKQ